MALDDFRAWLDINARDGREGSIALEAAPSVPLLRLRVQQGDDVVELLLDYSDAGALLDELRAGLSVLLARQGVADPELVQQAIEVVRRDTPHQQQR